MKLATLKFSCPNGLKKQTICLKGSRILNNSTAFRTNQNLYHNRWRSTFHTTTVLAKNVQKKTIKHDDDDDDEDFSLKSLLWKRSSNNETNEAVKEPPKKVSKPQTSNSNATIPEAPSKPTPKLKKAPVEKEIVEKDQPVKREAQNKEPEQPQETAIAQIDKEVPVKKEPKRKSKKEGSNPSATQSTQEEKKEEPLQVLTLWNDFMKQESPTQEAIAAFLSSLMQGAKIPEEQVQNYVHLFTISRIWRPVKLVTLDKDDLKKLGIEDHKHRAAIIQLIEKLPKDISTLPPEPEAERTAAENLNKNVSDVLEEMAGIQKVKGDPHRYKMYFNAAKSIRNYPFTLLSGKEALMNIPGIGPKIASEIDEVLEKGVSEKLEHERSNEDLQFVNELSRVTGVGPSAAKALIAQGVKTLDDLKNIPNLTHHQQLGLKYLDELELRIPRAEMVQMETIVFAALNEVDEQLIGTPCGSYRRGGATSGDLDMLLTHPEYTATTKHNADYLKRIVDNLKAKGFLTDDLSFGNVKYMGICQLPPEPGKPPYPHRRIDLRLVPFESYYCGLLYFTGSGEFNKWMRGKALEKGFTLSEYTICPLAKDHEHHDGSTTEASQQEDAKKEKKKTSTTHKERLKEKPLLVTSEEDVFRYLDLEYIKPQDRNWT
mmetsp:Transcript_16687/g.23191  ORF Transcript_16687/g.23191 Transcript_16687/m.23191 type:complete len:656 (-) Transcript_16687:1435-3402(-)